MQDPGCRIAATLGLTNRETDSVVDGTSIAISFFMTFIVTTIAVVFLGIVVGLVLYTYYIKKKKQKQQKNTEDNSYCSPQDENPSL